MSQKSRKPGSPPPGKPKTNSESDAIDSAIDAIAGGTVAETKAEPLPNIHEVRSLSERLIPPKKRSRVIQGIWIIGFAWILLSPLLILLQMARSMEAIRKPAAEKVVTSQGDPVAPSDPIETETVVENPPSVDEPEPDVEKQQDDTIDKLNAELVAQQKALDNHINDLEVARKQLENATNELKSKEQQIKTATEQLAKLEPLNIGIQRIQTSISDIQTKLTKPPVSPAQETVKNQTPPSTLTDVLISRLRKQKTSQVNLYWIPAKKGALNLAQVKLIRQISQQAEDSKMNFHAEVAINDSNENSYQPLDIKTLSEDAAYEKFTHTQTVFRYVQNVAQKIQKVLPATEVAILLASSEYMINGRANLPHGLICIVATSPESDGGGFSAEWKKVCADDQLYYYSPDKNLYLQTE